MGYRGSECPGEVPFQWLYVPPGDAQGQQPSTLRGYLCHTQDGGHMPPVEGLRFERDTARNTDAEHV